MTVHELWNSIIFRIFKTSLAITSCSNSSELISWFYFPWRYKIKHPYRSLLFNKVARCRYAPLLKRHWSILIFLWILQNIFLSIKKFPFFSDLSAHFMPLVSFYTPWKHQKTSGFRIFSGGIDRSVAWNGFNGD